MKRIIPIIISMAALVAAVLFMGMKGGSANTLNIRFVNFVGSTELRLDDQTYTNGLGQTYTISMFKYYVGNISLVKKSGQEVPMRGYYLVNEEEPLSKTVKLNEVPDGEYTSMRFIIGVDSAHNCSGAQSGALDPINTMFWAWNTGYIFMKLEGKSAASKLPGNIFEYHIGGYKGENNCIRNIQLNLREPLKIAGGKPAEIAIKTDAAEVLTTPTSVDFTKLPSVVDFHNSTTIADNYADMFSILYIKP